MRNGLLAGGRARPAPGCRQRNGIEIVGTLPGAFRHKQLGYVDALVMIQSLVKGASP
jgi:hypothetical protein